MGFDTIVKNGLVFDGSGAPARLGHLGISAGRVSALGAAPLDERDCPDAREMAEMERWLEESLDCGLLGLSTMTNPWDKLDGERHRSAQLPSTYATWKEYRRLGRVLRRRGRILQSAPNLVTKLNVLLFLLQSIALPFCKALRTTLITMA